MTSMEKEIGKSLSVIDVASAFEKLVLNRIWDLRVDQECDRRDASLPTLATGRRCIEEVK
jgi:hypothetical protein